MERADSLMTQEEYDDIQAEITYMEMQKELGEKINENRLKELKTKIE